MNQSNYKQNMKIKKKEICVEDIRNEQNIPSKKNPVTWKKALRNMAFMNNENLI